MQKNLPNCAHDITCHTTLNNDSLTTSHVLYHMSRVISPQVRECLFPMREGKESWIQLIAPDHNCCPDDGKTFCDIVRTLLERASVRRKLVRQLAHSCLDAFRLMVIRGDDFFVRVRA